MLSRHLIVAAAGLGLLAACVQATPDKVLRVEGSAPLAPSLCQRMVEDFDMVLAEGSDLRGRTYRVSHANRAISSSGISVNWGFRLVDEDPAESCVSTAKGMTCEITGPAEFRVQSNAGRATYLVVAGDRATVSSEGAMMTCHEPPAS
jgi:hypothetical protein